MHEKYLFMLLLIIVIIAGNFNYVTADDKLAVNTGVDFYNRYVWRGLDIAATPSIQPSLSITYGGFELGTWGAYAFSNDSTVINEIDFWLSYTLELENGPAFTLLATDYYFPNAGIRFFNFNNHDDEEPGAHTIELGLSITGPESFPVTVSGYLNVHNDAGNNTYFQVDYPVQVGETELGFFCGAAGGSEDNPDYYGADKLIAINLGFSASKDIKISDSYSLPLAVTFIVNPNTEISYLLVNISF
ncbi:MAG: hypothetical protein ABIJ45_14360 [Candidatus Zixiibacteriota bacterium]